MTRGGSPTKHGGYLTAGWSGLSHIQGRCYTVWCTGGMIPGREKKPNYLKEACLRTSLFTTNPV